MTMQAIVSSDYRVSCAEGAAATGTEAVVTDTGRHTYLPLVMRN